MNKLSDFRIGDKVVLARSPFPDRVGMKGTVVKTIKSRNVVRFLKKNLAAQTYDAEPENLEIETKFVKTLPVRVGDKFKSPTSDEVYEVIETRPGGHVELFDRARSRFYHNYCRVVKNWERVA